jgi:glyoxylase-like metal-dependent hydrolase (beta-lactamase superfamily II)
MSRVVRVLAPNPGPFTLEGTNTWVVGASPSIVIDPGPLDQRHLVAVLAAAGAIAAVLLTHHHPDHAPGAAALARSAGGPPVFAQQPSEGERQIEPEAVVSGGGVNLSALPTPGHSPDHVVFHDEEAGALYTGDAVLGRGTSVVDPPEGDMRAYLHSLEAMLALRPRVLYPGHGPVVEDGMSKLREYVEHRLMRERQVLEAMRSDADPLSSEDLVARIYQGYPEELLRAASRSVLAHLIKLEGEGWVRRVGGDQDHRFVLREGPRREGAVSTDR